MILSTYSHISLKLRLKLKLTVNIPFMLYFLKWNIM